MKKRLVGIFVIILSAFQIHLHSYYFFDDFSSSSVNWIYELKYSKDAGIWTTGSENESVSVTGGILRFNGTGYTQTWGYTLYGFGAYLTNVKYTASKETPFGFEITRTNVRLDYDAESYGESSRMRAEMLFYLAKFNPAITNGNPGAKFSDCVTFIEFARAQLEGSEPDTQPFSFFTYNESGSRYSTFDLSSLSRPNGSGSVSLVELLEWAYDDRWGTNTTGNGTPHSYINNNNRVKFRVTTDGENAYFYVNPNPDGAATKQLRNGGTGSFSNEFYLIGSRPITFTNDIVPMIALANCRLDCEALNADFDDFTIRSIASNVIAEISPQIVRAGNSVNIHGVIRPIFSTNEEAGIEEVYIRLPEGYSWTTAMTNSFVIRFINTNDGTVVQSFGKVNGDVNPSSGNVAISIKESGRTLKVRFNATSDGSYDVFHPLKFGGMGNANQRAIHFIISNFVTSGVADNIGKEVEIYVNNEKYADTGWSRVATTGRMKAKAGNAMDLALFNLPDGDTLTFRTCYDPVGLAALRAGNVLQGNKIYEGDSGIEFHYDFSTMNATINNASISRVEITVPAGFTIDPTYLVSDKIGASTNIYLTNSGSTIVVNYEGAGTLLPPVSGGDTVHFKILSTTNFSGTNEVRVEWPVVCYSSVVGTSSSNMLTNELYPLQSVLVRKKPPIGEAYVTVNQLRNTYYSNNISIVVKNMGATGNRIEMLRVALDPQITNVIDVQSTIPSTNSRYTENGTNFIFIDYSASNTNIINGGNDTVSFYGFADIPALTNANVSISFKVEADNRNGDGWVNIPEGTDGLSITYYTPFAEVRGNIFQPVNEGGTPPPPYYHVFYTDVDFATNVILKIRNDGEERNVISQVKIELPVDITNLANVVSLIEGGITTNYKIGNTNFIEIFYTNVVFDPADVDQISFLIFDSVESPVDLTFKIYAKNTTNYKQGGEWIPDNLTLNFIYPPALGKAYVEAEGGYIDSATNKGKIYVYITNEGRQGNIIKSAKISFDTNVFTNAVFVGSSLGAISSGYLNGVLELNYLDEPFKGGFYDTIELEVYDKVDSGSKTTTIGVAISNQRWWTNLEAPAGKSLDVEIIPPPTMYSYKISPNVIYNSKYLETNTNTVVISLSNRGWGSNYLDKVRVKIPIFLTNKIIKVSNELLAITNGETGLKISNNEYIWLEYDLRGTNLLSGEKDKLFVDVDVNFTNITNTIWLVEAANNSTNEDGSHNLTNNGWMLDGGTNYLYFVDVPLAYTTNTNIIAATVSNYLTFFIFNGNEPDNGRPLKRVRIGLPYPFSGISNIESSGSGISYQENATNFAEINYGTTGLVPGANDIVKFWAYDVWDSGEVEKSCSFEVDFGDGIGFRRANVYPEKTLDIKFINPSAQAAGYLTPNVVSYDFDSTNYSIFVINNGEAGNDILRLIVEAPDFITNITGISSSIKGGIYTNISPSNFIIYYTNVGGLASAETDIITFTAFDSIEYPVETNKEWTVWADNTLNGNGLFKLIPYGTGSFNLELKNPGYQALIYIEASNSISPLQKNQIYTSIETNILNFYVNNSSISGNFLQKLKINIPAIDVVLSTNYIEITSARGGSISVSNGFIWVDYSTPLAYNESDNITIKLLDLVIHYETNVTWAAEASFNTSAGKYRTASLRPGKSLKINYVVPPADGFFVLTPSEIYYNLRYFTNQIFISNASSGTADWDVIEIKLPPELTNGFNKDLIFGSTATNILYENGSGKVTFYYNNFSAGSFETIGIPVSNSAVSNLTLSFDVKARNYKELGSLSGNEILLTTLPEYYISPNLIDTATSTNEFIIEIWNTINGNAGIKKVLLRLPAEFSEIISLDSMLIENEAVATNGVITQLCIDYTAEGKEISKSVVKDVINIRLKDDIDLGNVVKNLYVEGDSGYGFVPFKVKQGGTNLIEFKMPPVYSVSKISPAYIYVGSTTNRIVLEISNTGNGSDHITFAKIEVPAGLENINSISSEYGGKVSMTNRTIYIDYTTNFLKVDNRDIISFIGSNTVNSVSNLTFDLRLANLTNNLIWYEGKGEDNGLLKISVILPPYIVYANFDGDNRLYIIETNASLVYRVRNGDPYGMKLTNLVINLSTNTNIFRYFNVKSGWGNVQINHGTNIVINYQNKPLEYNEFDDISIDAGYEFDKIFKIDFNSWGVLAKESESTNVKTITFANGSSVLWITNGGWGIVEGSVFPMVEGVGVKMYPAGSDKIGTNVSGENLITSTAAGRYVIKRVLPGSYKLEFSKEGAFKTVYTNIYVEADKILKVDQFRLKNAPLLAGATEIQQVKCYDDMESYILFPVNSLKEDTAVDILKLPFTEEQRKNTEENSFIKKPTYSTNMYGFKLDIYDLRDVSIDGATLNLDAVLYLKYDRAEIESRGWNEDELAIYYWDTIGNYSKWIRIGGTVDRERNYVSAKVSYLHGFYAVMGKDKDTGGVIRNVAVRPKVFTPKDKNGYFGSVRLTFELDKAYDRYEVRIYDLRGNLVKKFEREGQYVQGEVSWDATDNEGYPVKTGVYIYQIIAGNEKYSGTVIIAR